MTILCEPDLAAAAALATLLAPAGPVRTAPDLASAAFLIEAETDEAVVVVGKDAPLDEVIEFTDRLRVDRPTIAVLLLRHAHEPKAEKAALAAGVREVLPANDSARLADAVRTLH